MKMNILTMTALCGEFLLLASGLRAADTKPAGTQQTQNVAGLPKEAVAIAPQTYSYTDKDGKKWIFRQTPFGLAKFEDRERADSDRDAEQKRIDQIRAFDDGEFIRFQR